MTHATLLCSVVYTSRLVQDLCISDQHSYRIWTTVSHTMDGIRGLKFVIKALSLSPTTNRSGSIASYNPTLAYDPFPSVDVAVHMDRFIPVTVSAALRSLDIVTLRCLVFRYLSSSSSSLREVTSLFQRSFRNLSNVSPSLCSSPLRLSTPRFELVAETLAALSLVNDGALHMDW